MFFMCYIQMHTLQYTVKLIALHSFFFTLTLQSLCSVYKARQYIYRSNKYRSRKFFLLTNHEALFNLNIVMSFQSLSFYNDRSVT